VTTRGTDPPPTTVDHDPQPCSTTRWRWASRRGAIIPAMDATERTFRATRLTTGSA